MLGLARDPKKPVALEVIVLFFLAMVLYLSSVKAFEAKLGMFWIGSAASIAFLFLCPLVFVSFTGYDLKGTFSLKIPKPSHLAFTTLIVISVYFLIAYLFELKVASGLLSTDELMSLREDDRMLRAIIVNLPLVIPVFFLAVLPAITEEFLFRGIMLSGLANSFGPGAAIFAVGLLFGILHPGKNELMGLLGIILAYVVVKGKSILLAIYGHFLFNLISIAIFLLTVAPEADIWDSSAQPMPVAVLASSIAGLICGLFLLGRSRQA